MAKRDARFFFLIHQRYLDDNFDIGRGRDVLDMLRYDRAIVESNPPAGFYLFSSLREPTAARWVTSHILVHVCTWKAHEYAPPFGPGSEREWKLYQP